MSYGPLDFLRHILAEVEYLATKSLGLTKGEFLADETLQRALIRSLEVIGEASKRVDSTFRERHPEIAWRSMTGMRDRLIHGYFGVDLDLVWEAVTVHVPVLKGAT